MSKQGVVYNFKVGDVVYLICDVLPAKTNIVSLPTHSLSERKLPRSPGQVR